LLRALRAAPAALFAASVSYLAVAPLAVLADQRFPLGSRDRALWSAGCLTCGLLLFVAGAAWSVAVLRRLNECVQWTDILSPFQLWTLALRHLPSTTLPVTFGGTGTLAVLAAVVWVGGLSYWFRTDWTPGEYAPAAREALGSGSAPDGPPAGPAGPDDSVSSTADARPVERCVIVGYLPGGAGREAGLVLATLHDGRLTFAGVVRNGLNKRPELLERLSRLAGEGPPVEGVNLDAVWVRPEVSCEVYHAGADGDGRLIEPSLKAMIEK
jgi:hypothetical protein